MSSYGNKLANYEQPLPKAARWLRARIGEFTVVTAFRSGGRRNAVWRVRGDRGDFIFKQHNRRSHWEAEMYAYRQWRGAFSPFMVEVLADLGSDQESPYGMLFPFPDAKPLREVNLDADREFEIYREAGRLLRQMHDAAQGWSYGVPALDGGIQGGGRAPADVASDLAASIRQMAEKGLRLGCFSAEHAAIVHKAAEVAQTLRPEAAVPTHNDYTPGNWLVNADGKLVAIVDFENAGWGSRDAPLGRLVLDYFPGRAGRGEAFYSGYGRDLASEYAEGLWIGCVCYAAYYGIAGAELNDPGHRDRANRAFQIAARR